MHFPVCKLCNVNFAEKNNSHIISKFLGKNLFEGESNKYTMLIKKGEVHKVQSTVKEDNIFCISCESTIGKIEHYSSILLTKLEKYKNYPNDFVINSLGGIDFVECQNFNPYIFKLFIYSLLFRISISKDSIYDTVTLPKYIEEEVKLFLHTNLSYIDNYKQNVNPSIITPKYDFIVFMPENILTTNRGFQGSFMAGESIAMMLGNYIVKFFLNINALKRGVEIVSNWQNNHVNVMLRSKKQWEELHYEIIKDLL